MLGIIKVNEGHSLEFCHICVRQLNCSDLRSLRAHLHREDEQTTIRLEKFSSRLGCISAHHHGIAYIKNKFNPLNPPYFVKHFTQELQWTWSGKVCINDLLMGRRWLQCYPRPFSFYFPHLDIFKAHFLSFYVYFECRMVFFQYSHAQFGCSCAHCILKFLFSADRSRTQRVFQLFWSICLKVWPVVCSEILFSWSQW